MRSTLWLFATFSMLPFVLIIFNGLLKLFLYCIQYNAWHFKASLDRSILSKITHIHCHFNKYIYIYIYIYIDEKVYVICNSVWCNAMPHADIINCFTEKNCFLYHEISICDIGNITYRFTVFHEVFLGLKLSVFTKFRTILSCLWPKSDASHEYCRYLPWNTIIDVCTQSWTIPYDSKFLKDRTNCSSKMNIYECKLWDMLRDYMSCFTTENVLCVFKKVPC